jgi:outer membrane protein assembly factor BamB
MVSKKYFYLIVLSMLLFHVHPKAIAQWRGPDRDGKYPEKDLLKIWPQGGPELLWYYEGLGEGHSSVGIGKDRLFVTGMIDTTGIIYSFSMEGRLLWKKQYGAEWYRNYRGTRSTPVVAGELVYFESGQGVVYGYHAYTGDLVWKVDLFTRFNAKNIRWGVAESLLIDENTIYCTPGGSEHNVVALNRFNGETIWTSPGNRQPAAYCSPILVRHHDTRLLVTMTAESVIGIDADTGAFYWSIEQRQDYQIHANTPLYFDGKILCSSESDRARPTGMVQIQLSGDGKKAEVAWRNESISNLMGGFILKDGYVYGSIYNRSDWYCLDWNTGRTKYISDILKSGVVLFADGFFYCYTDRGAMALIEADEHDFKLISKFDVPYGTNQHWAHPVIDAGRLYIRHGNALMVYDIAEK